MNKIKLSMAFLLATFGLTSALAQVPARIEGLAFGADVGDNGMLLRTRYVANDNDFVRASAGTGVDRAGADGAQHVDGKHSTQKAMKIAHPVRICEARNRL